MRTVLAACLGFTALIAIPAHADVIVDTFTATIASGTDSNNSFGGGNLAGQSVSATLSFDPSQLGHGLTAGSEDYVGGGSNFNMSLTIGGSTVSQNVTFGEIVTQSAGSDSEWTIAAFNGPELTFEVYTLGSFASGNIDQPFSIDFTRSDNVIFANGERFTLSAPTGGGGPSPAPEPASAMLLGAGVLAIRAAKRRKAS